MNYKIYRERLKQCQKIVVKVGTSTLSYPSGRLNFQRIESLAAVISELQKSGKQVLLVSSGAIAAGSGRMGIKTRPSELSEKQALAALGQTGLMKIYQKFFDARGQQVAQVLLTKDIVLVSERRINASNTLNSLIDMDIIPIINENDTVATEEIEFGDNDTLSAYVACLVGADLLVMMTDIDGLYSADPRTNPDAKLIPLVEEITDEMEVSAKGTGNSFGKGGMVTKLTAASVCKADNIPVVITNGNNPSNLHDVISGKSVGTLFHWASPGN
jgi:glutamate 5-kinase